MNHTTDHTIADAESADAAAAAAEAATPVSPSRFRHGLALLASGVVLALLITCAFTPRFVLWSGLHVAEAQPYPEVNRAAAALEQLDHPFAAVGRSNAVIRWRLLMPVVAHLTRMPDGVYLALPHVGCVLVLMLATHLAYRATASWRRAWMAAAIVGASPWLFTSMGWLAYFDSWLVLAVLAASLVRSRALLATVFLLAPWVDERIIVAAPLCLIVRLAYLWHDDANGRPMRQTLLDAGVVALLIVPYVVARVLLIHGTDGESAYYVSSTLAVMRTVPWSRFVEGLWYAHRTAWVFIAALAVIVWMRRGWRLGPATVATIVATTAVSLVIAGDLSRSLAVLMPACLAGMLMMWESEGRGRRAADVAAAAVLLLGSVLPARHVVTSFVIPINGVTHELRAWRQPPQVVDARTYVQVAAAATRDNQPAAALHFLDGAFALDDSPVTSQSARLRPADLSAARQVVDAVLAAGARDTQHGRHALYLRGLLEARAGNDAAAIADLRAAMEPATPE